MTTTDTSHYENELAAYLHDLIEGYAWADTGVEAAEHIVTVLGWRPASTRVVETPAQLAAVEVAGCVIRETTAGPSKNHQLWVKGTLPGWWRAVRRYQEGDCTPRLPARVLWAPQR